jgi:hypothetical protein
VSKENAKTGVLLEQYKIKGLLVESRAIGNSKKSFSRFICWNFRVQRKDIKDLPLVSPLKLLMTQGMNFYPNIKNPFRYC